MNLQHSPSDILRYGLIAASGGTLPSAEGNWPIGVGIEPDMPDNCITVTDTSGKFQGRIMVTGRMVEFPGMQIRVRGANRDVAFTRATLIENILDTILKRTNVTIASSVYQIVSFTRSSQTLDLGKAVPQSQRHLFTLNGLMSLHQIS